MDTTEATVPDYPWDHGCKPGEFQCVYCGRYMHDRRAVRTARELGYKLHSCMACYLILSISRGLSFSGKQGRVRDLLIISDPPTPDHRVYVNREGQERILPIP